MILTRVDRCCFIFYSQKQLKLGSRLSTTVRFDVSDGIEQAIEPLTDPISGSPSHGKTVSGIICFHADDLFCVGDQEFYQHVITSVQTRISKIGSEDTSDVLCVGQRVG